MVEVFVYLCVSIRAGCVHSKSTAVLLVLAELFQALWDATISTTQSVQLCAQNESCSQIEVYCQEPLPETPWTHSMFGFELIFGHGLSRNHLLLSFL